MKNKRRLPERKKEKKTRRSKLTRMPKKMKLIEI